MAFSVVAIILQVSERKIVISQIHIIDMKKNVHSNSTDVNNRHLQRHNY